MAKPQAYEAAAATIRKLADDPETNWSFGCVRSDGSTHSIEEMENDGIEMVDVPYVLKKCRVTGADWNAKFGEWRYRVEGRNVDGVAMVFVVTITEEPKGLEIVTAWRKQKGLH